jgi:S-DNA-T family DNA segregation ATPase FtsK/SpoIIIE
MEDKEVIKIEDQDSLFEDAAKQIVSAQVGSTSLLQRKLKIGYNRAGRMMDQLYTAGIVGEFNPSGARQVLIKTIAELQPIFDTIENIPTDNPSY